MSGDSSEKQFVIVADARRRWTRAQKQAIVAECEGGKVSVSAVARKHNIAPNLLFRWRRELGAAKAPAASKPEFVPVALPALSVPPALRSAEGSSTDKGGLMEIELAGGRRLRIDGSVDKVALRRVIEVLEGR